MAVNVVIFFILWQIKNEISIYPLKDNGSFENRAFDRFVSMLPSPKIDNMSNPNRLSQQYSMSETDLSKPSDLAQAPAVKPEGKQPDKPQTTTQTEFDVNNFLAQLAGAGE